MQVAFRHRQETAGVVGDKRRFFVDCQIVFSEQEKAIIYERGLLDREIIIPSGVPLGAGISSHRVPALLLIWFFVFCLVAAGLMATIGAADALKPSPQSAEHHPWFWVFFWIGLGLAAMAYRRWATWRREASETNQAFRLMRIIEQGLITAYARDLDEAQHIEARVKDQLSQLKLFLDNNAAIKEVQRFEL